MRVLSEHSVRRSETTVTPLDPEAVMRPLS
jgi:hypothetical protein